jgi:hypothetical protein
MDKSTRNSTHGYYKKYRDIKMEGGEGKVMVE